GGRWEGGGIAGEKKPAVLHGLDDEAAHGGDALLQNRAFGEFARAADAGMQFLPDTRVRPVLDIVVGGALQVEPRQGRRAHGVKRKAALVLGIDQLVFGRRRLGQTPDPAERIFAIIGRERGGRNARPANAVKTVAAADEVAAELFLLAVVPKANFRRGAGEIVHA